MSRNVLLLIALPLIFVVTGGFLAIVSGIVPNPFEERIVRICEAALKDRLRSPSTYRRVKFTALHDVLDWNAALKQLRASGATASGIKAWRRSFEDGTATPTMFRLIFEYEAANALGTPIRSYSECTYFSVTGADSHANEYTVEIDGKEKIDLLMEQLNQLNR